VSDAPLHPQLIVLNGEHKGDVIVLDQPLPYVFGRRAGIQIPESRLDPVHCQIFPCKGSWYLQDFGSEVGTWFGDERIQDVRRLEFGRTFRIGDTLIAFLLPDEEEPADPDFISEAERALRAAASPPKEVSLEDSVEAEPGEPVVEAELAELAELVESAEAIEAVEVAPPPPRAKRKRKRRPRKNDGTDVFDLDVPTPATSNSLSKHDIIGDYDVIGPLGQGTLGTVYKCYDRRRRRVVTLKILDVELAREKEWVARFLRGAKAGSRLQHRHIVGILGAGHARGRIYVVQEYVEGVDLDAFCKARGGVLRPRGALRIASKITEALVYAHGRKVIHRAVTPANILIGPGGVPRLSDLTFAKRVKKPRDLDVSGAFTTRARSAYAPPEALLGKQQVGARADIYGVGACLFRTLTGSPPYGTDLDTLSLRMTAGKLEPWGPAEGKVSAPLRTLLTKCLEPDHEKRYTAMRDLRDAIADLPEIAER
jgi:hypothetical protein